MTGRAYGSVVGRLSFGPRTIVDGQVVIAYVHGVVITVFHIETWTIEFAERLYSESTALTDANPHTIVRLEGGEPGAAVRKRLAELQAELDGRIQMDEHRVAILTDSVVVRGAITAMRWLTGDQLNGFATDDISSAAAWVVSAPEHIQQVTDTYEQCAEYYVVSSN